MEIRRRRIGERWNGDECNLVVDAGVANKVGQLGVRGRCSGGGFGACGTEDAVSCRVSWREGPDGG